MQTINMFQAKTLLPRLVRGIEEGRQREIVITRNGRAVVNLVPVDEAPPGKRIGVAKGRFEVPDSIDTRNEVVAQLVMGEDRS